MEKAGEKRALIERPSGPKRIRPGWRAGRGSLGRGGFLRRGGWRWDGGNVVLFELPGGAVVVLAIQAMGDSLDLDGVEQDRIGHREQFIVLMFVALAADDRQPQESQVGFHPFD